MFFAYKKMLGRIETRTRDRIYCQTMREQLETFPETIVIIIIMMMMTTILLLLVLMMMVVMI